MENPNKDVHAPVTEVTEESINVDVNGHPRRTQILADGTAGWWSDEEVTEFNKAHQESM